MTIHKFTSFLFCFLFVLNTSAQKVDFKNYSTINGLPQSDVVDAVQDSIGYIWFATQGGGVTRFDGMNFEVFNQKNGLLSNFTNSLYIDKDSLFIGTNNGLSIKVKNRFINYNSPKINKIILLDNKIYLATHQGIYQYKKDYVTPIKIDLKIDLSNVIDIQYKNSFYWIKTSNKIWKTTSLNSNALLNNSTENESVFENQKYTFNHLEIDTSIKAIAHKIFIDKQQNTWVLTKGSGIYKSISSNFKHINKVKNLSVKEISATHIRNDSIWFTDTNRNLFLIDKLGTHFIRKNNFRTTSITTDANNNIWFGSERKGIYILRKQQDSLKKTDFKVERLYTNNGLPNNNIQNIIIQNNIIWVVTLDAGILKLNYDFDGNFVKNISRFNKNNGIKNLSIITSLLYKERIWYATTNGDLGYIYNDKVTHFTSIIHKNTPISNLAFINNTLFIGTLGDGIWKTTTTNLPNSEQLNTSFLTSKNINQLFIDSKKNVWIGSEKGLDKLEVVNNKISKSTHYNANDGFIGVETSKSLIIENSIGNLWFGTKNGITSFTPAQNQQIKIKPTIHFENIEIDYQSIDSIQKQTKNSVIQLSPTQNNISFNFKTIDINQPKRIEYQWILNENQSNWTTKNSINFANLNGNFIFSVKSRNASKIESEPISFHFFIDKPIYKKVWFIVSVIVLLSILLFSMLYLYFKRKQKENKQKIEKLTLENHLNTLEQKALQLQMNPHFIFNVLNGIKAYGNTGNTQELNKTISQFATLLRSLLHNSRKEEISLFEEIEALKNYLNLEQRIHSNFEFEIADEIENISIEEILIPPMIIQPFVENSIKHGFKNRKGKLSIKFKTTQNNLTCTIIDNGIGIEQSKKLNKDTSHSSVALKITKERIENLSKTNRLEIKELIENNKVIGTKVEFQIPLKTDF